MQAKLAEREPQTLARWLENDLYGEIQRATAGRPKFWFIDGPPYANGDIHIGHAVNKVLKGMIVKAARLDGFDAGFVPGGDRSEERRVGKEGGREGECGGWETQKKKKK